jgi:diphosphomevalonate decarboxylase
MDQNEEFISAAQTAALERFEVTHRAPSNIALVKYWGKLESQLPANASISFTLSAAHTTTTVVFEKSNAPKARVMFEGVHAPAFEPKIEQFLGRTRLYCPFLKGYSLHIDTSNTFPHSSGIASSASGMAALAMAVVSLEHALGGIREEDKKRKASFLARLGSGSAARSIEGPIVSWGEHTELPDSSDLFATRFTKANEVFQAYHDTIMIVHKGSKKVSSTLGHDLMNNHPYKEARFEQARAHMSTLVHALKKGNLESFIAVVESEALSLHAMMMTSSPYFILMEPQTLAVIKAIWAFREKTSVPVCFTLDAGANVHLLYPDQHREPVKQFIEHVLINYCEDQFCINDRCGMGAK